MQIEQLFKLKPAYSALPTCFDVSIRRLYIATLRVLGKADCIFICVLERIVISQVSASVGNPYRCATHKTPLTCSSYTACINISMELRRTFVLNTFMEVSQLKLDGKLLVAQ